MTVVKILMWVFTAICWWKIFEKAGIKGWKAIIPYYSDYVRFGMADKKWMYFPYLILSIVETCVSFIYTSLKMIELADSLSEQISIESDLVLFFWVRLVVSILLFIISIFVGLIIAAKFGKTPIFGIGLGVLPIVFAPIIAFDKSVVYLDRREI